jgi:peptide chain release factor 1
MDERLEALARELDEVEARLADPAVLADQQRYTELSRRHKELDAVVSRWRLLVARRADVAAARELLGEADADERAVLRADLAEDERRAEALEEEIRALLVPRDPLDDKDVIVEIRGAEGGEEANLFARDLFEMYRSWASARGWRFEVLGSQPSDLGGLAEVTFVLSGEAVWSRMKHEAGPHRVQRVPVTESQGRVHTSSATVSVLPAADPLEVDIDPGDLQVDVFRASGPGGQSVNTTDSAVRITHRPSGLVVSMQDEKSQLQNKAKAMQVLRARLVQAERERQDAAASDARRGQIGGGGRSEKVRTYNVKENRCTDHRIGLTLYRLDKVLAGDLDEISDALVADERARALAEDTAAP